MSKDGRQTNGCGKKHLLVVLGILVAVAAIVVLISGLSASGTAQAISGVVKTVEDVKTIQTKDGGRIGTLEQYQAASAERFKAIQDSLERIERRLEKLDGP